MKRRFAAAIVLGFALSACGPGSRQVSGDAANPVGGGDPNRLPVWVEAKPRTQYYAKCHIRTFKDHTGKGAFGLAQGFANIYVIDSAGPFKDEMPSPNAQCLFAKTAGEGDVVLHIEKGGDHSVRVREPMKWVRLNVW